MKTLVLVGVLLLSACGGNTRPLAYTHTSDPIWALSPEKWSPHNGNGLVQPPAIPAGRIPQQAAN